MEAHVETLPDRKRYLLPTLIVGILVILVAAGIVMAQKKKASAKAGAATAGAAGAAKGDEKNGKDKAKAPVPVSVAAVSVAPISSYISATANLVAEFEVKILAEAEGRVGQLLVDEGTYVRRGQVLAALAKDDAQILLAKARVRANNARVAYERAKDLFAKELTSRGDYDKTELEYNVAQQEVAEAEWRLAKTTIRAPFDGRVTLRAVQLGQHVRPGENLFTVTDFDPLIAYIYLPEKDVFGLRPGREVRLTLKAADDVQFKGRVDQVSPVVDTTTGTVKVKVAAVNPPAEVRPGAFVTVDIVRETHDKALLVPREAVLRELQKAHVFVTDGKVARKREVTLGIEEGDFVETLTGLAAGEKVVVAGQGGLKDGAPIKILPTKAS